MGSFFLFCGEGLDYDCKWGIISLCPGHPMVQMFGRYDFGTLTHLRSDASLQRWLIDLSSKSGLVNPPHKKADYQW